MKKKYRAVSDDGGLVVHWNVWMISQGQLNYWIAEFHGKGCGRYAREHAKRLNELPEEEQP